MSNITGKLAAKITMAALTALAALAVTAAGNSAAQAVASVSPAGSHIAAVTYASDSNPGPDRTAG